VWLRRRFPRNFICGRFPPSSVTGRRRSHHRGRRRPHTHAQAHTLRLHTGWVFVYCGRPYTDDSRSRRGRRHTVCSVRPFVFFDRFSSCPSAPFSARFRRLTIRRSVRTRYFNIFCLRLAGQRYFIAVCAGRVRTSSIHYHILVSPLSLSCGGGGTIDSTHITTIILLLINTFWAPTRGGTCRSFSPPSRIFESPSVT